MRFGVLGTGVVGRAIGMKLVAIGHQVSMGSRTADNATATEWADAAGPTASHGTFADCAAFGELLVNATAGAASLDILASIGEATLGGKVLLDIANPLDFSRGMPPTLSVCNTDSLAEQIQRAFPTAHVVKSLNTMNAEVMVDPAIAPGDHVVFVSGDDDAAKEQVVAVLESFGWPPARILDLGGIVSARGVEMFLPLWLNLYMARQDSGHFNIAIAR